METTFWQPSPFRRVTLKINALAQCHFLSPRKMPPLSKKFSAMIHEPWCFFGFYSCQLKMKWSVINIQAWTISQKRESHSPNGQVIDRLHLPDAFHTCIGVQEKATFQHFLIATIWHLPMFLNSSYTITPEQKKSPNCTKDKIEPHHVQSKIISEQMTPQLQSWELLGLVKSIVCITVCAGLVLYSTMQYGYIPDRSGSPAERCCWYRRVVFQHTVHTRYILQTYKGTTLKT